jgi:hypothetical protein
VLTEEIMAVLTKPVTVTVTPRLGALGLAAAGVLFAVYPIVRPYSDESTLDGAAAMASPAWIVAHLSAVVGFILLPFGLRALGETGPARAALVVGWLGVGLTLPYYGAEVFGANAIGSRALADHNQSLMDAVEAMRFSPAAATLFAGGLLLLAAAGILAAVAVWRSPVLPRWSGVLFAVAFALFIPQFFAPPALRIAHGLVVTLGCAVLAAGLWRGSRTTS